MSDAPRNIIESLSRVMEELPAIGKDQKMGGQQGYAYRGIEQITREVQSLFAKYQLVFVPKVESWEVRPVEVGGKPWTDTILAVSYQVWGSGDEYADLGPGTEGHNYLMVGPFVGIGRDNSDKGANKAITQAFKYALLQLLCISDSKDDGDAQTHEADAPVETISAEEQERREAAMRLLDEIKSMDDGARPALADWLDEHQIPRAPGKMSRDQISRTNAWLHQPVETGIEEFTKVIDPPHNSLHDLTDEEREMALVGAMKPGQVRDALRQRDMLDEGESEKVQRNRLMMALRADRTAAE